MLFNGSYDYVLDVPARVHAGQKTDRKEVATFSRFMITFDKFVTRVTFKV